MGEDELIQRTFAPLAAGFPGALGLKDDCAVVTPPAGHDLVLTTDAVAEGVHFFSGDAARDIAWKALAVNVSDLIAKGARPIAYLLSLSFPDEPDRAWLDDFAAGLAEAQSAFSISLAGGDTDRRPGPMSATVSAFGSVPHGRMVRRDGARAGDRLFVSGTIGDSALGLKLRLDPGLVSALGLDATRVAPLLARYLRPDPPLALAPHLLKFASAAMDISDGLVKDCGRLARVSGVARANRRRRVPLSASARAVVGGVPRAISDGCHGRRRLPGVGGGGARSRRRVPGGGPGIWHRREGHRKPRRRNGCVHYDVRRPIHGLRGRRLGSFPCSRGGLSVHGLLEGKQTIQSVASSGPLLGVFVWPYESR